jgi:2-oxoacid:acceptor oxidoreductase gamma subunit (pyruvate/2-ketoisovalerate family)
MKEIRLHGRAGQGARMASEILASAFVLEGKDASAFPMFGAERRGAPITAFLRFDEKPVRLSTQIYEPDCLVVLDPAQLKPTIFNGLKPSGILVLSTSKPITDKIHPNVGVIGFTDAMAIALEEIGRPIVNTCMLGVFAKTTGWTSLDFILPSLEAHFSGPLLEKNMSAVRRGFATTQIINFKGE